MQNNDFMIKQNNGVKYYISRSLERLGFVKHFFSTRIGGVSEVPFDSLNLGIYTEDKYENINKNYSRIFEAADMDGQNMVYLRQVHGDCFYIVNDDNRKEIIGKDGDALITTSKNIPIGVMTADCIPVIIVDSLKRAAAVAHAGWKGTHLHIVDKVVRYMMDNLGARAEYITAVVGPGIGPCCFEVKEDVAEKFTFVEKRNCSYFVDLWQENKKQLINLGVRNIIHEPLCTICMEDNFFSYRRDGKITGRMATFIEIT